MKSQRKAGIIISYASEGVQILSNLIYTPIMLRLLGQNEYGLYQLVFSVVSYLSLLSLSFGTSYMRFYSKYKKDDDSENIARLNGMFIIVFSVVSLICLVCGIVMVNNTRLVFGNGLTETEMAKAKVLLAIMVFNLMITFMTAVFNCITSAHEQFVFQKAVILAQNVLNPFITLPLLIMGFGSVGMVLVTTGLTLTRFILNVWFCIKKLNVKFIFTGFKFSLLKEMYVFTFFIFLNQIIDQINWSADKVLLGRFAGTTAVAIYGLGAQLNSMYMQFSTTISNVFAPRVNQIVVESNDDNQLTDLFIKVSRVQFMLCMLILTGVIFFGQPFIYYWGGEKYSGAYRVALCLLVPITIPLTQNLGIEIQRAKNKHQVRSIVYLAMAVCNVMLSIPLIKHYGVTGAAIGTALSLIGGNVIFMNIYYHYKMGLDMIRYWKSILRFTPSILLSSAVGVIMNRFIEINSIFILCLSILGYTMVYCMIMWLIGMNTSEKNMIYSMYNVVKNRLRKEKK